MLSKLTKAKREQYILDQRRRGYEYVSVKSLVSFIEGAIITTEELDVLDRATLDGINNVFIERRRLYEMEKQLIEHREKLSR